MASGTFAGWVGSLGPLWVGSPGPLRVGWGSPGPLWVGWVGAGWVPQVSGYLWVVGG